MAYRLIKTSAHTNIHQLDISTAEGGKIVAKITPKRKKEDLKVENA